MKDPSIFYLQQALDRDLAALDRTLTQTRARRPTGNQAQVQDQVGQSLENMQCSTRPNGQRWRSCATLKAMAVGWDRADKSPSDLGLVSI